MLIVGNALVSEDIIENKFACNTRVCHGACCVQGDAGAPLLAAEISVIEQELPKIQPFLSSAGLKNIEDNGFSYVPCKFWFWKDQIISFFCDIHKCFNFEIKP
ncbi:MAG: DUF3109 family protein, partial [Sphingomonadales bacterium]